MDDVSFLVVGDPFGATTHADLELRARERGIPVKVVHNASIMNAVGAAGLQLYKYGETISIVFWTDTWRPDSFYDRIVQNKAIGLHTLCLLDIKVKEPTLESLARGKPVYEPPRYMRVQTAAQQLLAIEESRKAGVCGPETPAIGVARVGADDQAIVFATLQAFADDDADLGGPLHSLILPGDMHEHELASANVWKRA